MPEKKPKEIGDGVRGQKDGVEKAVDKSRKALTGKD